MLTGIRIPFGSVVALLLKWTIAAIPAVLVLCAVIALAFVVATQDTGRRRCPPDSLGGIASAAGDGERRVRADLPKTTRTRAGPGRTSGTMKNPRTVPFSSLERAPRAIPSNVTDPVHSEEEIRSR